MFDMIRVTQLPLWADREFYGSHCQITVTREGEISAKSARALSEYATFSFTETTLGVKLKIVVHAALTELVLIQPNSSSVNTA